jgi:hypothetical protein
MEKAGFPQEVPHVGRIVVGAERPADIELPAVAISERDGSRCVDRRAVERRA